MRSPRRWYSMVFEGIPPQTRIPSESCVVAGVSSSIAIARTIGMLSRSTRWLPRATCSGGRAMKKQWVVYRAPG
eukprot:9504129-Alexandrium_andersonii.AAC.1